MIYYATTFCINQVVVKSSASSATSSTAAKLSQLNKRRRELEGDRSSVQRLTQVGGQEQSSAEQSIRTWPALRPAPVLLVLCDVDVTVDILHIVSAVK